MKTILTTLSLVAFLTGSAWAAEPAAPSMTAAENVKEYATYAEECIADNAKEGQTAEVVKSYCECMDYLIPENSPLSISEWEVKNPEEEAVCDRKSGWVKKK